MKKILAFIALVLIFSLIFSFVALASKNEGKKHGEETAGGHEEEAGWRIPGWQSIFAVLAIIYYVVVSMNILPKIAARKPKGNK